MLLKEMNRVDKNGFKETGQIKVVDIQSIKEEEENSNQVEDEERNDRDI